MVTNSLDKVFSQAEDKRWDLEKYVWSHKNHDPLQPGKRLIDFEAIENWTGLGNNLELSPDGKYFA